MNNQQKFIKTPRGDVIGWTPIQAAKAGNIPCEADGTLMEIDGVTESINLNSVKDRAETPWLGNPATGALLPYTGRLAQRPDLLSMRSEEEWEGYMSAQAGAKAAPQQEPRVPSLDRGYEDSKPVGSMAPTPKEAREDIEQPTPEKKVAVDSVITSLPEIPAIADLDPADAKQELKDWALEVAGIELDGRKGLNKLIGECEVIRKNAQKKESAAA